MTSPRSLVFVALLGWLAGPGCSRKAAIPPPVDVTGEVVYSDGKPVSDMIIAFYADDEISAKGRVPSGVLDKSGKFSISGVTPGRYKVTLAPIPVGAGHAANANQLNSPGKGDKKIAVPSEYLNSTSTPWKVMVENTPKSIRLVFEAR